MQQPYKIFLIIDFDGLAKKNEQHSLTLLCVKMMSTEQAGIILLASEDGEALCYLCLDGGSMKLVSRYDATVLVSELMPGLFTSPALLFMQ